MKKNIYAAMLLLGLGIMASCGGNGQGKAENKETKRAVPEMAALFFYILTCLFQYIRQPCGTG